MIAHRRLLAAVALLLVSASCPSVVLALAGTLNSPSISVGVQPNGDLDPVGNAVQKVLRKHEKAFTTGTFVNAHSTLKFHGKVEQLNQFLQDLSDVDGAEVSIRFAKRTGINRDVVADDAEDNPIQWSFAHNGWGNPASLSVTINPGDCALEEIVFPTIRGRARAEALPVKNND